MNYRINTARPTEVPTWHTELRVLGSGTKSALLYHRAARLLHLTVAGLLTDKTFHRACKYYTAVTRPKKLVALEPGLLPSLFIAYYPVEGKTVEALVEEAWKSVVERETP